MYNNKRFITFIIISAPIILLGILQILPTFDDWTTLSAPNRDPNFLQYFLPYGMTWRPGDALIGYVNGLSPKFFFSYLESYPCIHLTYRKYDYGISYHTKARI